MWGMIATRVMVVIFCKPNPNKLQKLTINFVLDVSGSMADEIGVLKERMANFVELFDRDNP